MLFLRIALGVAILAAIAATALVWLQVRPQVEQVITARNDFEKKSNDERAAKSKALKELAETKTTLDTTTKNLADTTTAKNAAEAKATSMENEAKALTARLNTTTDDLRAKDQQLSAWVATGLTVDQVKSTVVELKSFKDANLALEDEKRLMNRELTRIGRELDVLRGTNEIAVVLKEGTKGRILVVDPKWDFVVLDIGTKDELQPNGILMVTREGKLIGKVKVSRVQQDRSIANVLPGWKLQNLMEGDTVFY
jgi:hypothetical protein